MCPGNRLRHHRYGAAVDLLKLAGQLDDYAGNLRHRHQRPLPGHNPGRGWSSYLSRSGRPRPSNPCHFLVSHVLATSGTERQRMVVDLQCAAITNLCLAGGRHRQQYNHSLRQTLSGVRLRNHRARLNWPFLRQQWPHHLCFRTDLSRNRNHHPRSYFEPLERRRSDAHGDRRIKLPGVGGDPRWPLLAVGHAKHL